MAESYSDNGPPRRRWRGFAAGFRWHWIVFSRSAVGEAAIIIQQPEHGIQVWHHEFPYVKEGCCRLRFLDFFGWPRVDGYEDLPYYLVRIESMDGYPSIAGSLGLVNSSDVKVYVEAEE